MYSLLLLSFAALFLGPLVLHLAVRSKHTVFFVDAFVLCSVIGIVLFHVLPESIAHGGVLAVLAALTGLFAPTVFGKLFKNGNCHIHHTLLSLASVGLLSHAILDGMALSGSNFFLAFAVVLHRIPEGMGIWRLMGSRAGKRWALVALLVVAGATSAGFFFGESIVVYLDEHALSLFEGLMAGVLLHIIFHRHHLDEFERSQLVGPRTKRVSTSLGAICGIALVVGLIVTTPFEHSHAESSVRVHTSEL